jgi:hypothetical protein
LNGAGRKPRREHAHPTDDVYPGAEYTEEEREFIMACDRYRTNHNLRWLSLTDVLVVVKSMGYKR